MTFLNFFDEKNPQKYLTSHHKAHNYRFGIRFGESRKLVLSQFRAMPHVSQQAAGVDILQKKSKNAQGGKYSAQAKFG